MGTIKRKATFPRKFIAGADLAWNSNHVEGTSSWGAFQLRASPEDTSDSSRSTSYDAPERCRVCRGQVVGEGAAELRERVVNLERDYRSLVEEYRRDMERQQCLIQRLVAYFEETRGESQGWRAPAPFSRTMLISFNRNARTECKLARLDSETGQDVAHTKLQCELCGIPGDGRTKAQHDRVGCGMSDFLAIPPILGHSTEGWLSVTSSVLSDSSFDDHGGWYHFRGRVGRGQLSGTDEEMTEAEVPRGSLNIASSTPPLSMLATSGSAGQFEFGTELVPVNGTNYDTTSPLDSRLPTFEPHTYAEQRVGGWDDWTFDTTSLLAASPLQRGLGIGRVDEAENHSGAISLGVS